MFSTLYYDLQFLTTQKFEWMNVSSIILTFFRFLFFLSVHSSETQFLEGPAQQVLSPKNSNSQLCLLGKVWTRITLYPLSLSRLIVTTLLTKLVIFKPSGKNKSKYTHSECNILFFFFPLNSASTPWSFVLTSIISTFYVNVWKCS